MNSNIEDIAFLHDIGHMNYVGGGEFEWKLSPNEHSFAVALITKCVEVIADTSESSLSAETAYRQICQEEIHKYFFEDE